ncbi:MAG TPA: hypothetical protein VK176_07490 [Phycisphaerales bacterium]|nr:hypothetical protein [Phycisphaerales bacterium]
MASRPTRSLFSSLLHRSLRRTGMLADQAGRAPRTAKLRTSAMTEQLEPRVMLAGDHPSLTDFPNATTITLDGGGIGSATGIIEPLGGGITVRNDLFRFTPTTQDFVSILADAQSQGSTLNSRLEIYEDNGSGVAVQARDAFGNLIAFQSGNGTLSAGNPSDGWVGFVAAANKTYYVLVGTDATSGAAATGAYTVHVDARTTDLLPAAQTGEANGAGAITRMGQDIIYKIVNGNGAEFDSLMTLNAQADRQTSPTFDVHLDIYDANGVRIASDTDAGVLNDAFKLIKALPSETYYLRIRSDEYLPARTAFGLGDFLLAVDAVVNEVGDPIDPVTRRLALADVMADGFHTRTYSFVAQGTGTTIIAMTPGGPPPPPIFDGAISVYDENGFRVAFNDDRFGDIPQVEIALTGGQRYTILLDAFSETQPGVSFNLFIETHHTNDSTQTPLPVDDHVNRPVYDANNPPTNVRDLWRAATPLEWGDPFLLNDQYNYFMQDAGWRVNATGTGRIQTSGDNDLFSFIPQVDMQFEYDGDNGDDGPSLFVGGNFVRAGAVTNDIDYEVNNVATYDAGEWWTVGRGFNGAVRSFVQFDDDGDGEASLFAAGDFTAFKNDELEEDPTPANHIAKLIYNPDFSRWEWAAVGNGVNFNVYSMVVYDQIAVGDNPDPDPILIIGGQNGMSQFDGAGFTAMGGTINGIVHALATYQLDEPDPDGDGSQTDPPPLIELMVGGTFTTIGPFNNPTTNTANRLATWSDIEGWFRFGTGATTNGANGAVYALQTFDPPVNNATENFGQGVLIGGDFTRINGTTFNRISFWTVNEGIQDAAYDFVNIGSLNGAVRSITLWDPIDPDGSGPYPDLAEQVVLGGDFTNAGNRVTRLNWFDESYNALGNPLADTPGFNSTVHALTVMEDADDVGTVTGQPILYAGGAFTLADDAAANRGAQLIFDEFLGDWVWASLGSGRDNGTSGTIFALSSFQDSDPNHWDHEQRRGSRLHLTVTPSFGPNLDTTITVYDSNFNIVYTNANVDSAPWGSQLPDGSNFPFDVGRSGMVDPNLTLPSAPLPGNLAGITLWGGRTYYLQVSGEAGSTGRYDISITAEAYVADGPDRAHVDPVDESDPASGVIIPIPAGTGDNTNYLAAPTNPISPPAAANNVGLYSKTGWVTYSDYGQIETVDDTDVYQFRAQASGYAAIRINTTNITDEWHQDGPGRVDNTDTYSSDLDSYIRVLDGDFTQIAFNDDNPFSTGEPGTAQATGNLGNRIYQERDGYVVFPIVEGDFYYIVVGSGQKWVDASPEDPADRVAIDEKERNVRVATGSYEILFDTMLDLDAGTDDHGNTAANATPIAIGFDPSDAATNGKATVNAIINNAGDLDGFVFNSPARGIGRVTISRPTGSTLVARVIVYDSTLTQVANNTTPTSGDLTLQFSVLPGAQYFISVGSEANTTGTYTLSFNLPPFADDHADETDITNATTLKLFDYLGSGEANGSIENPGDVDVFRFEVNDYETFSVRVRNLSPNSFDPRVEIYELSTSIDADTAKTMWHRIAANNDLSAEVTDAQVSFSVTPNRTSLFTGQTYRWYYVFVMAEDRQNASGNYKVEVSFPPTDDFPDATEYTEAAVLMPDPDTGLITQDAMIELSGDTDLFYFNALAGGNASIIVDRQPGSTIIPRITVIQLTPGETTIVTAVANDSGFGFQAANTGDFAVERGAIYYILVEATTEALGGYTITLASPPLDDYPNAGEWSIAHVIPISSTTGDGAIGAGVAGDPGNAKITPDDDTDLFRFTPVRTGLVVVTVTSYRGTFGNFAPILTVFDANLAQIGTIQADAPAGINDPRTVELNFSSLTSGQVYYIQIASVDGLPAPATRTGEYYLTVNGLAVDDGGGGDPGAIDFNNPTSVPLSSRTGDGFANSFIDVAGDRDLFTFTAPATGKVFVQVVTPTGSVLDASVTLLRAPNELPSSVIFTDNAGIPGATANGAFDATGGQQYWAIVSGIAAGVGAYRLRIDAEPETHYLYYPEGYASLLIREFVSVSNANNYDVRFSVKVRYEDHVEGQPDETVVASNIMVEAGARGGVTISNAEAGPAAGVQLYRPYAIIIESDGPLGATFSHYDFSSTLGDSFTGDLSASWNFARVERNPGAVFDFLVYYNPNNFDVNVLVTFYTGNAAVTIPQTIAAGKRLGLSVNDIATLPTGVFGATVVAAPANPANESAFIGIVAALSHYDSANTAGFGYIGDGQGGSTKGAIPSITQGTSVSSEVSIFNPGTARATVTLTGKYLTANLPPLVRTFDVPAGQTVRLTGAALGITSNQAMGISYSSNVPVVMASSQTQNGDADSTLPFTEGSTKFFFGDAFINTALAGSLYFETLSFYNPTAASTSIVVTLLFTNSDSINVSVPISPRSYAQLKLHELPELIVDRPGLNFFSVIASSAVPFAATMTHYDLFLQGGFTTAGVPLGLSNAFNTIP